MMNDERNQSGQERRHVESKIEICVGLDNRMKTTIVDENRANGLVVCKLQAGHLPGDFPFNLLADLVLSLDLDDANRLARLDQQINLTARASCGRL